MVIKRRSWFGLCIVGMLLFVLGALQYRWITEASRAEQERLKQDLLLATNRVAQDFEFFHFGVLARVVQPPRAKPFEDNFEATASVRLSRQHYEWMATSPDPELVQDLFITKTLGPAEVGLFRFDPDSQKLVES